MIKQHKVENTDGDIAYQFIDENKIKKVYINQQIYNALVSGSLVVAKDQEQYAYLPKALAEKLIKKCKASFWLIIKMRKMTKLQMKKILTQHM